jgi:4-hydroxybenzoate polyprenyltransferase
MNRLLPYARLVRLPNVFTALADIGLGGFAAWATADGPPPWPALALLLAASACLYSAGMVWNDFFDLEQDRRERPFRPLPSEQISLRRAAALGAGLLLTGVVFARLSGLRDGAFRPEPLVTATALAGMILLYDGWLKRTWAGPVAMGACRFLNVMLGLTLTAPGQWPWPTQVHVALVVGLYIVGVTWFARTEARRSNQTALTAAAIVMLSALVLALAVPVWWPPGRTSPLFPYLLVAFGFFLGVPLVAAIRQPMPKPVQAAVKRSVLGLVLLDAVLATAVAGTVGLALAFLLLPALYLGRWVYST